MSGARFARSGRARFFLCFLALVLMLGMVAIFHNTTRQLDTSREQQLLCEQNQKTLNEQLQAIIEQKYTMQKNYNAERNEQMKTRLDLEQKLKKHNEQLNKEQMESHAKYEKLQQAHKLLQSEHKDLIHRYDTNEHLHLENIKTLNRKVQDLQAKTQKEQTVINGEVALWQEKYNALLHEKQQLETLLNEEESKTRLVQLEHIFTEYQAHCAYQPKGLAALQNNKPLDVPQIAAQSEQENAGAKKSFSQQVRLDDGRYQININNKTSFQNHTTLTTANKISISSAAGDGLIGAIVLTTAAEPIVEGQNRSLILNSVENFQILPKLYQKLTHESQVSPLGAPHKPTSTEASKAKNKQQLDMAHNSSLAAQSPVSSTSGLPPLPLPPQSKEQQQMRKLPDNVAPIPEHFEEMLKNDEQQQQKEDGVKTADTQADSNVADKPEQAQKEGKDETNANNNRYANVVNDMSGKAKENEAAYVNEQSFNVPVNNDDDNNHFFDAAETNNKANIANAAALLANNANEDDFMLNADAGADVEAAAEVGDIDMKQKKQLLDADNVNNEVAGDQGKEFEGIEEDADEDDYASNMAARQQGEQVIRN